MDVCQLCRNEFGKEPEGFNAQTELYTNQCSQTCKQVHSFCKNLYLRDKDSFSCPTCQVAVNESNFAFSKVNFQDLNKL